MALIQTVHLSMANFKSAPVVPAVQNDSDRQVKMIIDDYTLTSGLTGKIAFERSDGTHYETAAELVLADNAFVADIDQALTQPGRTMVQLKVTDTLTVSTFSFVIFVEEDTSGTVTPQEGIDLVTAVEAAEAAADRAESAATDAETSAESVGNLPNTIAPGFLTTKAYAIGDYVMRNGHLYQFIAAHSAGAWNSAEVIETNVGADIKKLNNATADINNIILNGTGVHIPLSWSQGNINTVTGLDETGTRQRSDYVSILQSSFVISWDFPISDCVILWYDENKTFKNHSGWKTNGSTIANSNKFFRIMARKNGSNQLTDNEIKSFKVTVSPIWDSDIDELDSRVDSLETINDAFSLDDSALVHDEYFVNSSGNLQTYTTSSTIHYYASDFIDVAFCEKVKVHTCLGSGSTIAVYNGMKEMTRVITTQGSTKVFDYDITLANGERYIRSSFQAYSGYTTKDQFTLIAYKNVILALDSIAKSGGESNNAVEKTQLKPLPMPTVVFIDDDGSDSLWETTVPIFESAGVPLTIAVGKDSAIMSDLATLRTWLATEGHDMVQHSLGSDQDLSAKTYAELIEWIESEQAFFYNNGFLVTNLVYGGANWSEQMIRVIEKYYNCGCTIPNWQLGITYGYNLPGTSRYKLARYAVSNWTSTSGHSLQDCKDIFDEFIATGQNGLIVFYSHSYQLVDNPDRVQIITDFLDYVKASQANGACTITTLSAIFG